MKFEKFIKRCGTNARIARDGADRIWVICGGVGMMAPEGVDVLGKTIDMPDTIMDLIDSGVDGYVLVLYKAIMTRPDGRLSDMIRAFADYASVRNDREPDYMIGIMNDNYGLLEKGDQLSHVDIGDDHWLIIHKGDEIIGFISGVIL